MGGADDQHGSVIQLFRTPVLTRMELKYRGIEFAGEVGHARCPAERARRHDDIVAVDRPAVGRHQVARRLLSRERTLVLSRTGSRHCAAYDAR